MLPVQAKLPLSRGNIFSGVAEFQHGASWPSDISGPGGTSQPYRVLGLMCGVPRASTTGVERASLNRCCIPRMPQLSKVVQKSGQWWKWGFDWLWVLGEAGPSSKSAV